MEILQNSRLSLRKEKLDDLIHKKRVKYLEETKIIINHSEEDRQIITSDSYPVIIHQTQKNNRVDEKTMNERFLNLSLNKPLDIVRSLLNRNQICHILDKSVNELRQYNIKSIQYYELNDLKLCVFKLRDLLTKKGVVIEASLQILLYDSLFTVLEKYNHYCNFDIQLIVIYYR